MLTMAVISGFAVLLPGMAVPAQPSPVGCEVIAVTGRCLVEAADPGRPGGPRDPDVLRRENAPDRERAAAPNTPAPPPPPLDLVFTPLLGGGGGGLRPNFNPEPLDILLEEPAAGPAEVLAQRAVRALTLQPPAARLSADVQGFVGVPLWLWVEGGVEATGPVSATATAGASEVTATGRLTGVEWEMGPPGALVRCAGTGTPWAGQSGPSPDCGFTYTQRSTPERTGGTGRWLVTVTAVWQVTWDGVSGGAPVAGEQTLRLASAAELVVGEVQVLVDGSGEDGDRSGAADGGGAR